MAYRLPDGGWKGVYQHSDGYPDAPYGLPHRMRQFIAAKGAQALVDLIEATPQGFSFFDPAGREIDARRHPYGAYLPGDPAMVETGDAGDGSYHGYLYVVEPDGSVSEVTPR